MSALLDDVVRHRTAMQLLHIFITFRTVAEKACNGVAEASETGRKIYAPNFVVWYTVSMSRLQFLKKNREKILALADKRGGYNVRVFGSVARGEENQASDIDFLITFRKGTTLFDRGGLVVELGEYLGCDVAVVSDKAVHPLIRDDVYHSAIAL